MTKEEKTMFMKCETILLQFHNTLLNVQQEAAMAPEDSHKRKWLQYAGKLIQEDLNSLKKLLPNIEYLEVD